MLGKQNKITNAAIPHDPVSVQAAGSRAAELPGPLCSWMVSAGVISPSKFSLANALSASDERLSYLLLI